MQENDQHWHYRKIINPPNPLIAKLPTQASKVEAEGIVNLPVLQEKEDQDDATQFIEGEVYLGSLYQQKSLIFRRWENESRNHSYFASYFWQQLQPLPMYVGQVASDENVSFDSNFESGNLYAAFRVGPAEYDLVMQNDLNTGGFNQWFNFRVENKRSHLSVKFNIVNFYKKQSLFREGMKPSAKSLKYDKRWKKNAHSVCYFPNEILIERRRTKHYRTLSFVYDFIFPKDLVQIAYTQPYTLEDHRTFIKCITPLVRIKYLGVSPLKTPIEMIQICSQSKVQCKKAIVLLARQHSGETVSSFVIEEFTKFLLMSTFESDFLKERFNFYIIPMVNVDGVVLGNYRCNAAGFDLNRYWCNTSNVNQPEINFVKNEIKKILSKQPIELIIDVHGHSNKMNSFFYGNVLGSNYMLFPYITSTLSPLINFSSCQFQEFEEQSQKMSTARVVLGNLIKGTGHVYTYEISLYGSEKNGRMVHFNESDFQELARSLMLGMFKTFLELSKQETCQRESPYLKEINKSIRKASKLLLHAQESDQEASVSVRIQQTIRNRQTSLDFPQKQAHKHQTFREEKPSSQPKMVEASIQVDLCSLNFNTSMFKLTKASFQNSKIYSASKPLRLSGKDLPSLVVLNENLNKKISQFQRQKHELLSKLTIFGAGWIQSQSKAICHESTQTYPCLRPEEFRERPERKDEKMQKLGALEHSKNWIKQYRQPFRKREIPRKGRSKSTLQINTDAIHSETLYGLSYF